MIRSALLTGMVFFALCGTAWAQGEDLARKHFEQGIEFFEEGKFEEAAIAFERAYELKPSYRILFNIAQTENELGHYAAALMAYTSYLAEGGDEISEERRAQVQEETTKLNLRVGMIIVRCPVADARLRVDGEDRGLSPFRGPVFVDLGRHQVKVSFGDTDLHEEVVRVAGGERVVVEVEVSDSLRERLGATLIGEDDEDELEPEPEPGLLLDEPAPKKRVWTWVALGVGAGAGIAGGILGGVALSKKNDLMGSCEDNICNSIDDRDEKRLVQRMALSADIMYGVAAAGVIAGVVLFFVEPKLGSETEGELIVAPSAHSDGAGLMIQGRF